MGSYNYRIIHDRDRSYIAKVYYDQDGEAFNIEGPVVLEGYSNPEFNQSTERYDDIVRQLGMILGSLKRYPDALDKDHINLM